MIDIFFSLLQDEYNLNPGLEWEDEFTGRWFSPKLDKRLLIVSRVICKLYYYFYLLRFFLLQFSHVHEKFTRQLYLQRKYCTWNVSITRASSLFQIAYFSLCHQFFFRSICHNIQKKTENNPVICLCNFDVVVRVAQIKFPRNTDSYFSSRV